MFDWDEANQGDDRWTAGTNISWDKAQLNAVLEDRTVIGRILVREVGKTVELLLSRNDGRQYRLELEHNARTGEILYEDVQEFLVSQARFVDVGSFTLTYQDGTPIENGDSELRRSLLEINAIEDARLQTMVTIVNNGSVVKVTHNGTWGEDVYAAVEQRLANSLGEAVTPGDLTLSVLPSGDMVISRTRVKIPFDILRKGLYANVKFLPFKRAPAGEAGIWDGEAGAGDMEDSVEDVFDAETSYGSGKRSRR